MYFTLKDGGAQIKGVMFRSAVRYLKFKPEDGLHVIARGRLSVYEPKGEYQIVCEHLEPHGLGALQLAFEQLKKKLQAEGLFDAARKRPLPALPRRIGVVTSLDGAAMRDIIRVLRRRIRTRTRHSAGARAGRRRGRGRRDGARAHRQGAGVDVIIVGRGGGSIEDLWAFNEEGVARAIVASPGADHFGGRPRNRLHDRRFRRRPARADAVGGRRDGGRGEGRILRAHRSARRSGCTRRRRPACSAAAPRCTLLESRRGLAGWQTRLAMRGRHAAELTHQLPAQRATHLSRRERAVSRRCGCGSNQRDLAPAAGQRSGAAWPRRDGQLARRPALPAPRRAAFSVARRAARER